MFQTDTHATTDTHIHTHIYMYAVGNAREVNKELSLFCVSFQQMCRACRRRWRRAAAAEAATVAEAGAEAEASSGVVIDAQLKLQ